MSRALTKIMRESDPFFSAPIEKSDDNTKHWFKSQIVELANSYGYYLDLQSYHKWIRLKMLHSLNVEQEYDEFVISIHSLGTKFFRSISAGWIFC